MNTQSARRSRPDRGPRRRAHGGNARSAQQFRGRRRSSGRKQPTFDPSRFINTNPVEVAEVVYEPTHTFATFGLRDDIVKTIHGLGITTPSPIQDQSIPHILEGRDVIGLAETGTGKTAAFLVPLIERTLAQPKHTTLILTPTRELALQIEGELKKLAGKHRLFYTTCVGGTSIRPQLMALKKNQHFIIGTPGRILDLINRGALQASRVSTVVLDEADRMLDMGFINDMRAIMAETPRSRNTLFFSATMTPDVEVLVNEFLHDPVTISVKKRDVTNSIEQDVVPYTGHHKYDTLLLLLKQEEFRRVIIFGAMKHSVERLSQELSRDGVRAVSIHGNKSHGQRQQALRTFKSGNARVMVATDVAARGIHVDNVSHVINYDLPTTFEDYVHRIGRTGRGSARGKALTFIPATDAPAS